MIGLFSPGDIVSFYAWGGRCQGVIECYTSMSPMISSPILTRSPDWFPEDSVKIIKNPKRIRDKSMREWCLKKSAQIKVEKK